MDKKKIHADELVGAIILGAMAVLTFVNVVNRYVFKNSIAFTEEITINLFVWITLIGISMAVRKGANLKMTNLYDRFSPKLQKTVTFASGVVGVLIFAFIIYNSVREIWKNMTFYHTTSESLGIPTWIYSLGTPIFSIMVIQSLVKNMLIRAPKAEDAEGGK